MSDQGLGKGAVRVVGQAVGGDFPRLGGKCHEHVDVSRLQRRQPARTEPGLAPYRGEAAGDRADAEFLQDWDKRVVAAGIQHDHGLPGFEEKHPHDLVDGNQLPVDVLHGTGEGVDGDHIVDAIHGNAVTGVEEQSEVRPPDGAREGIDVSPHLITGDIDGLESLETEFAQFPGNVPGVVDGVPQPWNVCVVAVADDQGDALIRQGMAGRQKQ